MKRILEVQKEIGVLGKDSNNPFFKSSYLDLNKLLTHVMPLLHKHDLILTQPIEAEWVKSQIIDPENGKVLLSSEMHLPDLKDPQKLGSAITYFRRYTLKSLLAIAEGDDDANLASVQEPVELIELTLQAAKENAQRGVTLEQMHTMYKMTSEQDEKYLELLK